VYPYRAALAVPYWNGDTYRAAVRSIVTGHVGDGCALGALRSLIVQQLGVADALLCGSGSLALETALSACGIGGGDEVIVPAFCCTAVIPPILNVGAIPVFADIGDELNITAETFAAAMTEKTRAVVVPHLFGNPAEIAAIAETARARNICVIDDAAQAFGATVDGRPAGSFGDAGILSFGPEKICFGIGGGVAVSTKKDFLAGMDLPRPNACNELQKFFSTVLRRRWRRWSFPLEHLFSAKPAPDTPPARFKREAMSNLAGAVSLSLVNNIAANIARRRERVRRYNELLTGVAGLHLTSHRPGSACLTQVVRLSSLNPDDDRAAQLIADLRRAGYEAQGSYVPIHLLPDYACWRRRLLPRAERVWADLVELPCEPSVSIADVERIAALVKEAADGPLR
jgi:dTDP-4-amino-4,6-dideoxygalactose transaminase